MYEIINLVQTMKNSMKTQSDLLGVNCGNSFPFLIMFLNQEVDWAKKFTCLRSTLVMSTKLSTIVGWLFLFKRTFDSSFES
jgi:hypothetical protein